MFALERLEDGVQREIPRAREGSEVEGQPRELPARDHAIASALDRIAEGSVQANLRPELVAGIESIEGTEESIGAAGLSAEPRRPVELAIAEFDIRQVDARLVARPVAQHVLDVARGEPRGEVEALAAPPCHQVGIVQQRILSREIGRERRVLHLAGVVAVDLRQATVDAPW